MTDNRGNEYVDVKIADTKLSSGTNFTSNQNTARRLGTYNIRISNPPIKGLPIIEFQAPNLVKRDLNIDFYKIYSNGTSSGYGGVKL